MREGYATGTNNDEWDENELPKGMDESQASSQHVGWRESRRLGEQATPTGISTSGLRSADSPLRIRETGKPSGPRRNRPVAPTSGRILGTFRNTYYDFPTERDFSGETVPLQNAQCKTIAQVPRGFYEAVCVQGSGLLASGSPVSFNRRDCDCAETCPRTQQRICFDSLDIAKFPWGRGATGGPITPLLSVAVDSSVIPLGTSVYIPEYEGLPRDPARKSFHDGCFIAQDRGLRVVGQHVDIFTGQRIMTETWNGLVPSNTGVTVVLDSAKCARASD